jgi:hypothetical protein
MFWHIHPDWEHPSDGGLSFRHRDGTVRSITSTANLHVLARDEAEDLDTYSPAYGAFQRGTCLRARVVLNSPSTIATFMTATAVAGMPSLEQVDVTEPPGANWHAAAFRLAWSGHEAIILCAIERVPDSDAGTPGRLWGGERARTDGRVAFIQLGARNPTPPIQVLGTRAEPAEFAGSGRA